jgi:hypothetical protein
MRRVVIFIPGIMGSRLRQENDGALLWHESVRDSFSKMAENPSLFKLDSHTKLRADGILSSINICGWPLFHLCKRLRKEMAARQQMEYTEFAYDWRQNLFNVAQQLGDWTCEHYGFQQTDEGKQYPRDDIRLRIVAHSMGGIVAALALMQGHLDPYNVDRFITIGTPFLGAPAAFRGLFDLGYLPGLTWLESVVNFRLDRRNCRKNMREAFQSFQSTYQLLPHENERFVEVEGMGRIHPFELKNIADHWKNAARQVHNHMVAFADFIDQHPKIQTHFIYTNDPNSTDSIYRASAGYSSFEEVQCFYNTSGDGTVEDASSSLRYNRIRSTPVAGAKHAYMCNNKRVVDLVIQFLN